jgi:glucosamine--fructose-6-phosphate aminotransferase (isomerizing)
VKARGGRVIAVGSPDDEALRALVESPRDVLVSVPACPELWSPFLTVIPLQLLAYHVALRAGRDVDQPRNLAKSVTVE